MSRDYTQFQIRAFRRDGGLSAYLVIPAGSVDEATGQAGLLISYDTPKAEIWSDGTLVDTIDAQPVTIAD